MDSQSKKVLLMGRAGAGKTSMRSIVFANNLARDTKRLTATNNVEHSYMRFLNNMVLSLWDCGGQDTFLENYFDTQRNHIFRNAEVLIYVLEVRGDTLEAVKGRQRELEKDFAYFKKTVDSLAAFSPAAQIFCLVHKMDLVREDQKQIVLDFFSEGVTSRFASRGANIKQLHIYATSIWDETLYRAWSEIAYILLPNVKQLETYLDRLRKVTEADEVILFEKSTFLVVAHSSGLPSFRPNRACQGAAKDTTSEPEEPQEELDESRFERLSNICKQFKLTCLRAGSNFSSITLQTPALAAFIERFTQNTYIVLVIAEPTVPIAGILCNLDLGRDHLDISDET